MKKPNLRDRITIKSPSYEDTKGEDAVTYAAISGGTDVPAMALKVGTVSALESIRSGRPEGKQRVTLVIRDDITILSKHRIDYRGFEWQVQGMPDFMGPRDRYQTFTAIRTDA